MTQNKQASRWWHKVDRDRAATKVVEAVKAERKGTRLVKAIPLDTRVKVRINPGRDSRWWREHKVVARRATATTMVTRLWREPGTRRLIREWRIGWAPYFGPGGSVLEAGQDLPVRKDRGARPTGSTLFWALDNA